MVQSSETDRFYLRVIRDASGLLLRLEHSHKAVNPGLGTQAFALVQAQGPALAALSVASQGRVSSPEQT
jgi:hypothetical protein